MARLNSSTPLLQMQGISKRFGATIALEDVDLSVDAGQVHALVGENGAGKSTLMKVLSGALQVDSGTMLLDGKSYLPSNPLEARRLGVAMIYQELSLAPHLSVEENIVLGVEPIKHGFLDRKQIRKQALEALEKLNHQDIPPDLPVRLLPVGLQQIVEIARSVAGGCKVLVLDEPTSSLSRPDVESLFYLIESLKKQGHAIIYISHFLEEVQQISDQYSVLRDGRIVGSGETSKASGNEIVDLMIGRRIEQLYPHSPHVQREVLLEIDQLAGMEKPASATLKLHRGEVVGIAGLVGAGRTELLRALFGLDPVRSGKIKVGTYFGPSSPVQRWKQGIGILSEDRKEEGLAASMGVADNLTLSCLENLGPAGFVLPSKQERQAQHWIERLGIRCRDARQSVSELSGGNQQKVALARLLHHDVDVLLLDEPTRGIDVASKAEIYRLIDDLACRSQPPKAILMVSSYIPELLEVCDRIAVMCRGHLGSLHKREEVDEHQIMLEATGTTV